MDDLLPSYENAINQDPWALIAQYLPSDSLCAAALVCRKWHQVMAPQLWGNPASHFEIQNDTLYVALTRFKRVLSYVRPFIRELTHTLQLPPAHAEIYGGPHAEWLRDCLEYLPRLQCLLVNGLPFFDHSSLLCLRHASLRQRSIHPHVYPVFGLRLLDASGCTNATSTGLAEALSHLPNLVSLDLSRTLAAKDPVVLDKLRFLSCLRLLSLQGLALKDADFAIVASAIGTRVRSLDVTENHLTDASARALLDHCLKDEPTERRSTLGPLSPVEPEGEHVDSDLLESENIVSHVRRKLTEGFAGSLAIERARNVGITHLCLSKNAMTVEGISGLLRSRRLQVLDVGILPSAMQQPHPDGFGSTAGILQLPGVAKLTPILAKYASEKLKYLRINYEIVTEDAPLDVAASPRAELDGDLGHYTPSQAHEMEANSSTTLELDTPDTNISELQGDSPQPVELHGCSATTASQMQTASELESKPKLHATVRQPPEVEITSDTCEIKRGAAYAPEVVPLATPHVLAGPVDDGFGRDAPPRGNTSGLLSPNLLPDELAADVSTQNRTRKNSASYVEDRQARLELRQTHENRLHPNMLPKVHTLVLTDIPTSTNKKEVIDRIIQYVKDAAEASSIARQQAEYTYALPPGRCRAIAEREHAHSLFALRRIVLEIAPPQAMAKKVSTSWRAYPTKSSTEDSDSEAFWDAATQDFSFFGEEECGVPEAEPGRSLPLAMMSGLELVTDRPVKPPHTCQETKAEPLIDVVAEIAKFRKDRKAAHVKIVQVGQSQSDVEGYWPGDITVVRRSLDQDSGELDFYGNRYQSGWHYR